ncbi:MAG TPA: XdhC family protein [Phycisphaerae bacterium]|nr:XdhC family protein [Phycisphaerae bacterium]
MDRSDRRVDACRKAVELADHGEAFAVALVLSAAGSTPRKAGVRAVIDAGGAVFGTIGGGPVEAEAQRRAVAACASGQPAVLDLRLDDASPGGDRPICGGSMRVLIDPTAAKDRAAYAHAAGALEQGRRGVLLTTVRGGERTEVEATWLDEAAVPACNAFPGAEAIASCLAREQARLFRPEDAGAEAGLEAFVEPVVPDPVLLIVGGGHIGQALARQAVEVGFDVTVLDDRPEFTDPRLFPPSVATRHGGIGEQVAGFPMAADTYVVIVTRGHQCDADALAACVRAPAAYVGMIGSKRKVAMIRESFLESGRATEPELARVFAPIGLDIGAVTVPEIAASIVAELIAVRRKGRECPPPKHMTILG